LAKEKAYKLGFYEGILTVGDYAGLKVEEAKTKIKELLISTS
jgi:leucyl-tRNA synthetase